MQLRVGTWFLWVSLSMAMCSASLVAIADEKCDDCTDLVAIDQKDVLVGVERGGRIDDGAAGSVTHSSARVCSFGGTTIPCRGDDGVWWSSRSCYVSVNLEQRVPDFPNIAPDLTVMRCITPGGGTYLFTHRGTNIEPPPPDPELLARRAIDVMHLKPIRMGTFPRSARTTKDLGYVGWNTWMWAQQPSNDTWGPISAIARLDGWSVRAVAKVDKVVWDMGDNTTITCSQGTPWTPQWTHNEPSPDCGHVYHKDGNYQITATSYWRIHWDGIGRFGTIDLQLTDQTPIRIAEAQILNIPPTKTRR